MVQVTAIATLFAAQPLQAEDSRATVYDGICQYSQQVAAYRNETTLVACDTAKVDRSAVPALEFRQTSWGVMARFIGDMTGNAMTVSRIALRDGRIMAATGTCEIFYRKDGSLSVISCLAKAGSRPIAVNFVRSRL